MRNKKFFDAGHAMQQLTNSIIRVGDAPVMVMGFSNDRAQTLVYLPLAGKDQQTVSMDSRMIDLNPVPLGFSNYFEGTIHYATYVMRTPQRNWNIGLTYNNVNTLDVIEPHVIRGCNHDINNFFRSQALTDTILGVYPNIQDIFKAMNKSQRVRSQAFSRRFAINRRKELFFKWNQEPIGMLKKDLRFDLMPPHECLSQILTEDINDARV